MIFYLFFFIPLPPTPFLLHVWIVPSTPSKIAPSTPSNFLKKFKKVFLSSYFSFSWSLWDLRWAPKAYVIAFQKSRVDQDHFLRITSMSWPGFRCMPRKEYHILSLFWYFSSSYWSLSETGNWAKKSLDWRFSRDLSLGWIWVSFHRFDKISCERYELTLLTDVSCHFRSVRSGEVYSKTARLHVGKAVYCICSHY